METRRQVNDRRLQEVGIVFAKIQLSELIRQTETTIVGDVKEVSNEADACAFVNRERNVRVQVELAVERRASQLTSSTHGHFTGVQVNRMRQKLADRYTRLGVEAHTDVQPRPESPVEPGALTAEAVARVNVRHEATVRIQRTDLKLIAEQVEVALRKVE